MSKLFYGSISLSDLIEKAKQKHEAFKKANNGKIYIDILVWLNEEEDKYGNIMSVQVNAKEKENKFYIGNLKASTPKEPETITDNDIHEIPDTDDLPW